jgi:hypothetical protein
MKSRTLFDHIKQITEKKVSKDYWKSLSVSEEKSFSTYLVNRYLSMNMNWIDFVNSLQKYTIGLLKPKEVYHVYEEFIPQGKVYLKWIKGKAHKKYNDMLVDYVKRYYEVSSVEAKDYIDILSRDEKGIESLTNIVKTYGVDEKELKRVMK